MTMNLLAPYSHYSGQTPAQYCKVGIFKLLRGLIIKSEEGDQDSRNVYQLPEEYRPIGITNNMYFPIDLNIGSQHQVRNVQISKSGIIVAPKNNFMSPGDWFSLDGIIFI